MTRAPCRDVATHRAGADDVNVADLVATAGELPHLLAQKERADQVLRRRRHHQIGEGGFFGRRHRRLVAAVLLPEVDQRVRRGIVLMRRGLFGFRAHARGEKTSDRTEIEDGVQQPGPGARQTAEHGILDGVADVPLLRHGIDQPERLCPPRIDGLAGQHQRHRLHWIDETREARGAAKTRMQAEHHFRKTKAGAVDRNARLAGERDFEAATEAEAVNDSDGWNLQSFKPVDHRVRPADRGLDLPRIGRAAKFIDVRAGDEAGFLGRANDKSRRPLALQRHEHGAEFFDHISRERIGAGALAVEQQPGDAVAIAGQLEMAVGPARLRRRPDLEHAVGEDVHDP